MYKNKKRERNACARICAAQLEYRSAAQLRLTGPWCLLLLLLYPDGEPINCETDVSSLSIASSQPLNANCCRHRANDVNNVLMVL